MNNGLCEKYLSFTFLLDRFAERICSNLSKNIKFLNSKCKIRLKESIDTIIN